VPAAMLDNGLVNLAAIVSWLMMLMSIIPIVLLLDVKRRRGGRKDH
jgi:hypothetical protein